MTSEDVLGCIKRITPGTRRRGLRVFARPLIPVLSVGLATPPSIVARNTQHPVTAAVVFVVVILINGAVGGLAMGLLAAALASIIFNFFLRFPVYQFGFDSIDDVVPLFAFTITAIVSGALSGRLADRARVAENARNQLQQLLWLSNDLQGALTLDDIAAALTRATADAAVAHAMFRQLKRNWPASSQPPAEPAPPAKRRKAVREGLDPAAALTVVRIAMERRDLMNRQAKAEAALEAERFKTALLSCVSHDLRTPLAVISMSAGGLARYRARLAPETQVEMLATIEEQCERLKDFVERMLQLSRLEVGLSRDEFHPVDVGEALRNAVRRVRQANPARTFECDIDGGNMPSLGHSDLLEQAFLNILENAVRYSPAQSEVSVRLDRQGSTIRLQIVDERQGISADDLPHIFERFYRGGNAGGSNGMGLGLSFSRDFIVFMGGSIAVESPFTNSKGTRVEVRLPATVARAPENHDAGEDTAD